MIQTLTITDWVPQQISNGPVAASWRKTAKAKKAAKIMAWACAKQAGWAFVPGRVRLTVTYTFPVKRARDRDNLYSRTIGLVNGLKGEFFTDDSIQHLDLVVADPLVEKGVKSTRIELEPIS